LLLHNGAKSGLNHPSTTHPTGTRAKRKVASKKQQLPTPETRIGM
jgi:hypothetical protein